MLAGTANQQDIEAALPDIGWGHGRVDAFAALQQLDAASGGGGAGSGSGEPSAGPGPGGGGGGEGSGLDSDFSDDEGCQAATHAGRGGPRGLLLLALAAGALAWRRVRAVRS